MRVGISYYIRESGPALCSFSGPASKMVSCGAWVVVGVRVGTWEEQILRLWGLENLDHGGEYKVSICFDLGGVCGGAECLE